MQYLDKININMTKYLKNVNISKYYSNAKANILRAATNTFNKEKTVSYIFFVFNVVT